MIGIMSLDVAKIQSIYDEARELINNHDFISAISILEEGIKQLNKSETCFFDEIFQLILWTREGRKNERRKGNGYAIEKMNLYYHLGYCFVELGDNEKAMGAFKKALKFHPYDVHSRFEIIQILNNERNFEMAREALQDIHRYIFRPDDLAHLYRDYGWIFIETQEWEVAATCYISSFSYADESGFQRAENELGFIEHSTERDISTLVPNVADREKIFAKYQIPLGFNKAIVDAAFNEYQKFQNKENDDMTRYLREICLAYVYPLGDLRDFLMTRIDELKNTHYAYKIFGEKNKDLSRAITINLEIYYLDENEACMLQDPSWDVFEMQVSHDVREKIYSADEKVDITEEMKDWLDLQG